VGGALCRHPGPWAQRLQPRRPGTRISPPSVRGGGGLVSTQPHPCANTHRITSLFKYPDADTHTHTHPDTQKYNRKHATHTHRILNGTPHPQPSHTPSHGSLPWTKRQIGCTTPPSWTGMVWLERGHAHLRPRPSKHRITHITHANTHTPTHSHKDANIQIHM